MIRQAQIAFIRAEALRLFEAHLDASALYYSLEYKSSEQVAALEESASLDSAVRELRSVYGTVSGKGAFPVDRELSTAIRQLRELRQDRSADLLADALARLPREAIAA